MSKTVAQAAALIAALLLVSPRVEAQEPGDRAVWRRVDHVAAEVGPAVITRSELESEARLALLRGRGADVARTAALSEALLTSVLRAMVQRELLLAEARRLQVREASQDEVRARVTALVALFESEADALRFFERIGFSLAPPGEGERTSPPGLVDLLRAQVQLERFVELRVRPSVVVRSADVEACFAAQREHFTGMGIDEARPTIEAAIREAASDRALAALLVQLARRTTVRVARGLELGPIAAPPSTALGLVCP